MSKGVMRSEAELSAELRNLFSRTLLDLIASDRSLHFLTAGCTQNHITNMGKHGQIVMGPAGSGK
jgi:hypothetical protein